MLGFSRGALAIGISFAMAAGLAACQTTAPSPGGADLTTPPASMVDESVIRDATPTIVDATVDAAPAVDQVAVPSCSDGVKNQGESDIDCGGPCPKCGVGRMCGAASDCGTSVCKGGICIDASCSDMVKNGNETDVDCGGSCPKCGTAKSCGAPVDCASGVCKGAVCVDVSCSDGVKNGSETDVDCGGSCPACSPGKSCAAAADCKSTVCKGGVCLDSSCSDGVKNGGETDVDCGGTCPPCAALKACGVASDCASMVCTTSQCAAPTCTDAVKNGNETDVDCGGTCPKCAAGKSCGAPGDCTSGVCSANQCTTAGCNDGIKNGSETDVDCGGSCPRCGNGKSCGAPTDCASGVCGSMLCAAPSCSDNVKNGNETDVDCGGSCPKCAAGKACGGAVDCASGACVMSLCVVSCTDGVKDGNETDVDCGGGTCPVCADGKGCKAATDCKSNGCDGRACIPAGGQTNPGVSCKDLLTRGVTADGVYYVAPGGKTAVQVFCDMTTDGGGFTICARQSFANNGNYLGNPQLTSVWSTASTTAPFGADCVALMKALRPGGSVEFGLKGTTDSEWEWVWPLDTQNFYDHLKGGDATACDGPVVTECKGAATNNAKVTVSKHQACHSVDPHRTSDYYFIYQIADSTNGNVLLEIGQGDANHPVGIRADCGGTNWWGGCGNPGGVNRGYATPNQCGGSNRVQGSVSVMFRER